MSALFQNSYYIGIQVNSILYGVELVLYFQTMSQLLRRDRDRMTKSDKFFIGYSTALLILITIFMSTEALFGEEMWVLHANIPGGPAAYFEQNASIWYQTWGTAASVVLNWLADGFMIYRCFVVWNDYRVIIIPGILYLGTWALGILDVWASGSPGADIFAGEAAHIVIAYFSTTIGLNVLLTVLICSRIIAQARRVRDVFGAEGARTYTNAAAVIIESALPYTAAGIATVVSMGLNSDSSILMGSFFGMFACVSPQLLILRVLSGRVWTRGTTTVMSTFVPGVNTTVLDRQTMQGDVGSQVRLDSLSKDGILVSTSSVHESKSV